MNPIDATDFMKKVRHLIEEFSMLEEGDSVLIGLSGGADSVALFRALCFLRDEYRLNLSCAHVNHHLRKSAERDAAFSENLCQKMNIPFVRLDADVSSYAAKHQCSKEAAGRQIRYDFFQRQTNGKIATAHTKDDNAETVLWNLMRGNYPTGIPPVRNNIIRPLLSVTKEEIYGFLAQISQDFVTDETNFSTGYTRNRIRLELIPYIQSNFNKNFKNTTYNTTQILQSEQDYFNQTVQTFLTEHSCRTKDSLSVNLLPLRLCHPAIARKVLRRCYYEIVPKGGQISLGQIETLLHLCQGQKKGKRLYLDQGAQAVISGEWLVFCHRKHPAEPTNVVLSLDNGCRITIPDTEFSCFFSETPLEARYCYPVNVSAGDTVCVRFRQNGDKIYLKNISAHKKLSDFFTDKKIPLLQRDKIPVVTVNGEIRVVVGYFYKEPDTDGENLRYLIVR